MPVTTVFEGHACQCCAGVIANGDESGCRHYYGHTHRSAQLGARETRQLNEIHNVDRTADEWTLGAVVTDDETMTYVNCDFCDQDMGYHDGHAVAILADFVETT